MLGAREDVVAAALDAPAASKEELARGPLQLKGLGLAMWVVRLIWDGFWNRVVEKRAISIPRKAMDRLRQKARDDLPAVDGQNKPFISDGDILTAWLCRMVALSLPGPRPLNVFQAVNTRFRLPCLIQAPGLFINNMTIASVAIFPPDVACGPLGLIALNHRERLAVETTEAQVLANWRHQRDECNLETALMPSLYGPSDAVMVAITNWCRADIFNVVDFSGAVVKAGGTNPPGKPATQYFEAVSDNPAMPNTFSITGMDREGNYWIQGMVLPRTLERIEESLREIS